MSPDDDWMQTYTGRQFWLRNPDPAAVDPRDIAHALSLLCRYGGHVKRFYSVAEHCVLMSLAVPAEDALAALLHDATEAYVVDLPRPVKRLLPGYRELEATVWEAIVWRFDLFASLPGYRLPESVKDADNRILLTERAALMGPPPADWGMEGLRPLPVTIVGWAPVQAEARYHERLGELTARVPA